MIDCNCLIRITFYYFAGIIALLVVNKILNRLFPNKNETKN